ncbi:MAG: AraC family transcriptional regulator [Bacteroidia bacterium]|nr:AraC family transcriptional regulator [Bacteroidia bacterium]
MADKYVFTDVRACTFNFSNGKKAVVKPSCKKEIVLVKFIPHTSKKNAFQETVIANYPDSKNVQELAKYSDYECIKTFTRHFKKYFNQTPYQWMLDRKMEEVHQLVLKSDLSISEIAKICGFKSLTHLVNAYTNRFGISPFRNRTQENRNAI